MTLVRARLANYHDRLLTGNGSVLQILSNKDVKQLPDFQNVLLDAPWRLGAYATRNRDVFKNIGGTTATADTSFEHELSIHLELTD
jgi:hypothetical protein